MKFKQLHNQLLMTEDFAVINNKAIANTDIAKNRIVGIAKYGDVLTTLGKNVSPSKTPNIDVIKRNDKIFFVANQDIPAETPITVLHDELLVKQPEIDDTVKFVIKGKNKFKFR